jgi:hypothetical protein
MCRIHLSTPLINWFLLFNCGDFIFGEMFSSTTRVSRESAIAITAPATVIKDVSIWRIAIAMTAQIIASVYVIFADQ